jgi:hypothetical protein
MVNTKHFSFGITIPGNVLLFLFRKVGTEVFKNIQRGVVEEMINRQNAAVWETVQGILSIFVYFKK